jgi:hypothetical protein
MAENPSLPIRHRGGSMNLGFHGLTWRVKGFSSLFKGHVAMAYLKELIKKTSPGKECYGIRICMLEDFTRTEYLMKKSYMGSNFSYGMSSLIK